MKTRILVFAVLACFVSGAAFAEAQPSTASLNAENAARTTTSTSVVTSEDSKADTTAPESTAPAPIDQAATVTPALTVSPNTGYRIIPGDVLQINVWKEEGLDQEVLVLPDGMITFPLVGSFSVLNTTPEQVQEILKEKLKQFIPDATVTVSVKAALGHTVSVIGQVTKPGEFIMNHGLTVMQALSQAGGLTPYADEGGVIVLRRSADGTETSIEVPYDDISRGKELTQDIVLEPGDVVVVPTTSLF